MKVLVPACGGEAPQSILPGASSRGFGFSVGCGGFVCHFHSASVHCVWAWSRGGFVCLGCRVGFCRSRPASVVSLVFLFWAAFGVGFGRLLPRFGGFVSLFILDRVPC